jgi:hypothetical protein
VCDVTSKFPTVQWSEEVPPVEVATGEQLDQLLDRLAANARPDFPISVRLKIHLREADILLGLPESFVYINELEPRRDHLSLGDPKAEGVVTFYLLGAHHTEFERSCLIPLDTARRVLREFFKTGRRSDLVKWRENWY